MKARVKATGEIVEVTYSHIVKDKGYDIIWYITPRGASFSKEELEFIDTGESSDYWTRLEHTYAGMAMQGLMAEGQCSNISYNNMAEIAIGYAHALVEKLKKEEEK